MTDAAKLHNVRTELNLLNETWRASAYSQVDITVEWTALRDVNAAVDSARARWPELTVIEP